MDAKSKIKYARDTLGMSRKQFADLLGVSDQTVRIWEGSDRPAIGMEHLQVLYGCGINLMTDFIIRDGWTADMCRIEAKNRMEEKP